MNAGRVTEVATLAGIGAETGLNASLDVASCGAGGKRRLLAGEEDFTDEQLVQNHAVSSSAGRDFKASLPTDEEPPAQP